MPSKIDLTGRVFGQLSVVSDGPKAPTGRRTVVCLCHCGEQVVTDPRELLRGHTTSCGCFHRERVTIANKQRSRHGMAGSPEYNSWVKMKARCLNRGDAKYSDYGGRGVTVCDRWEVSFDAFYADMGPRPEAGYTIDRINVNGNYEPSNCRWASPKSQARNKRNHRLVEVNGRRMPLSEACELTGVNYRSALYRLNLGKHWRPLPSAPATGGGE